MFSLRPVCGVLLTIACCNFSNAQQAEPAPPQVLLIVDAAYQPVTRDFAKQFAGKVKVGVAAWPKGTVATSTMALEHLEQLLGRCDANGNAIPEEKWPEWDLIQFNVGLGDLVYRVPGLKSHRLLPIEAGGVVTTAPGLYEDNLDQLVKRMKELCPNAKLVWAHTTPIRHSRSHVFEVGSAAAYNTIAERVMKQHEVPVSDMHSYVVENVDMNKPAGHGADPFNFHREVKLARQLAKAIAEQLEIELVEDDSPAAIKR